MQKRMGSPAAAHAELLHVFGFGFLRFGVGVSILEFFWLMLAYGIGLTSVGAMRLVVWMIGRVCIRSLPVNRWYDDRSRPRIDSRFVVPCSKLIKSSSPKIS